MAQTLFPVALPPGLYKNGTLYQAKGRWADGNLVRFTEGTIRPVGGWRRIQDGSGATITRLTGVPRAVRSWRGDSGDAYTAFGTTAGLYILLNGAIYDVTPAGFVAGAAEPHYAVPAGTYGSGSYGVGNYGVGSSNVALVDADTWALDTFGNWLIGVSTSERILREWHNDTTLHAVSSTGAPGATAVVVTPEQFVMLLGADDGIVRNIRNVAWASQGTTSVWTPLSTNSAGSFELNTDGRLMCGRRARGGTLLWTDCDVWMALYIGGQFVYRFDQVGSGCGIIAPNAVVVHDGIALWMGREAFFQYDGRVAPIPCDVSDYVFNDFNRSEQAKVHAVHIPSFSEVWWMYPSGDSTENDRVVIYNYREGHWSVGQLDRACGYEAGATVYPIMCRANGGIFEHEILHEHKIAARTYYLANGSIRADGSSAAGEGSDDSPVYLESGPVELGDGDQVVQVQRLVPDTRDAGQVEATFYGSFDPMSNETSYGPYSLASQTDVRFTARQVRLRIAQVLKEGWRVGLMRLGIVPRGQR
jgi:hypothetical protein